tara:strand:+ start:1550 stop:1819 length:270 start_codon:yes stop_codon:yes gene_type:complete
LFCVFETREKDVLVSISILLLSSSSLLTYIFKTQGKRREEKRTSSILLLLRGEDDERGKRTRKNDKTKLDKTHLVQQSVLRQALGDIRR